MTERRPDRVTGGMQDTFWAWCNKLQLRLPRCATCHALAWPIVRKCERCGSDAFSWESMSGSARVVSWCSFEQDYYRGLFPLPHDTLLVELDEGVLFITNPLGFNHDGIEPGMAVQLAFLACEDGAGRFQLPVFERRSSRLP